MAREAGKSRNPLYSNHRYILDEIENASEPLPSTRDLGTRIEELERTNTALRAQLRELTRNQQSLATENLGLLHRAQVAENRLAMRDRTQS